jgi:hypothetical protein
MLAVGRLRLSRFVVLSALLLVQCCVHGGEGDELDQGGQNLLVTGRAASPQLRHCCVLCCVFVVLHLVAFASRVLCNWPAPNLLVAWCVACKTFDFFDLFQSL